MIWHKGSYIEDLTVDDDPDIIFLVVFGNLIEGKSIGTSLRWLGLGLGL